VAQHHQRGIGEIVTVHAQWLARLPGHRKRSPVTILMQIFSDFLLTGLARLSYVSTIAF
jgi:hypothetical protein